MIKTLSDSHLRAKLATVLDQAGERLEPIIVERRGKPAIALMDANELSSMMELIHLLRSPANAKRLIEAIEESPMSSCLRDQSSSLSFSILDRAGGTRGEAEF